MKVLIVDDIPANRKLLRVTLQTLGHATVEAEDGLQALKVLADDSVDAVISDILMPNMDGYRFCYEARQSPKHKNLPIILYTSTYQSPGDRELALRFGASAFLEKPAPAEKLDEVLREVVARPAPKAETVPADDLGSLKQYSERLISKIEEKNIELQRRTEELEEGERKFRQLAENIPEVFFVASTDFMTLHYVSPAYETIWGRPCHELYADARKWMEAVHPEDREEVARSMQPSRLGEGTLSWDYRIVRPDGGVRVIHAQAYPVRDQDGKVHRYAGIAQDITERRSLESQLYQAQKMEAVGRLAGGVAHDFNNLLTAINGYSELAMQRIDPRDPLYRDIEEVRKAGERAAGLTRQLLAFSRKQVLHPRVINLNAVVTDMERLLKRLIGEDVELVTSLAKELGSIKADPGQIEQVIVNLAVNARDAMPNGGRLTLETANVDLDESYARNHREVRPGPCVMVAVTDTGTGMTDAVKARLFEPFFTTKETGKGTGLGLATVHGIVKQSGGHVGVYSELGRGTSFKVYLPRVNEPAEAHRKPPIRADRLRGSETILLVEDDVTVRTLAKTVLAKGGYRVLEARSGDEALMIAEKNLQDLRLVISDLILPGINGIEVVRRLLGLKSGLRTLYVSGYTDAAVLEQGLLAPDTPFLTKPYSPDSLLLKVREVLDTP